MFFRNPILLAYGKQSFSLSSAKVKRWSRVQGDPRRNLTTDRFDIFRPVHIHNHLTGDDGYAIVDLLEFYDRTAFWKVSNAVELEFSVRIGQSEETAIDAEETLRCVLWENIRLKRKGLRQTG
jgi:hypothetical protein